MQQIQPRERLRNNYREILQIITAVGQHYAKVVALSDDLFESLPRKVANDDIAPSNSGVA